MVAVPALAASDHEPGVCQHVDVLLGANLGWT